MKFVLFGYQHLAALLLVALFSVAAFRAGGSRYSSTWSRLGAAFFALYGVGLWTHKLSNGIQWGEDLPLQLCDVVYLLALASLITPRPVMVTLVTYWGLSGTLQALLTPDLQSGFPSMEFGLFFVGHSAIVLAVFFLLGRAPHDKLAGKPGLTCSFGWLLLYTVAVTALDFTFDLNYGYLREKPAAASILDFMGPWPVYVLAGLSVALVLFCILSVALKLVPPRA